MASIARLVDKGSHPRIAMSDAREELHPGLADRLRDSVGVGAFEQGFSLRTC
jgi:hypothetical protein